MSLIVVEDDSSDELETVSNPGPSRKPLQSTSGATSKSKQIGQEIPLTFDERSYDDAETVDTADNSNDDEDKPLLDLMKQLINYNNKQNSKLTNKQLAGILKKEFSIDVANLHFMSVEIYTNVLKKFLKDWPQWDEFDLVMHETRCMNDVEEIEKMLESAYNSLKEYLATILEASKPFAKEALQKLKRSLEIPASCRAVPGDVILEINCTRDQLNTLFFRKPHPAYNSTIFNIDSTVPSKISLLSNMSFQSILNSCYVNISINMTCFKYKREFQHNFKHTLVNKKLKQLKRDLPLNSHLQQYKNMKTTPVEVPRREFKLVIDKIQRSNRYSILQQYDVDTIFRVISEDLNVLPESTKNLEVPSTYRHYMSKYPYIRHLYKDVQADSEKYDLQLEEKISPMLKFHINKLSMYPSAVNIEVTWLKLECTICQIKYHGVQGIDALKTHFREEHQNEPNWTCSHCDKEFKATELAASRWHHRCENAEVEEPRLFA